MIGREPVLSLSRFRCMKLRRVFTAGICFVALYIGSYAYMYGNMSPAANLAYFVYLKGGEETAKEEWVLYYFYYPIYKPHELAGGARHNYDRPKVIFPKGF